MKQVGIDFGTTTIQIAQQESELVSQPLPIAGPGQFSLPSVIAYKREGTSVVKYYGLEAMNQTPSDDCIIIRSVKQALLLSTEPSAREKAKTLVSKNRLGNWEERFFDRYTNGVAFWKNGAIIFDIFGQEMTSLDIARDLFCGAIENTLVLMQKVYDNAVICCPVDARLAYRKAVRSFLSQNNLVESPNIIDNVLEEASLAAQSLLKTRLQSFDAGDLILVYDFGGGTFDTALARVEQHDSRKYLSVLCSANDPFLGGDNIDEAILAYVLSEANHQIGLRREDLSKTELYLLRRDCKRAKEDLSRSENVDYKSVNGINIILSQDSLVEIIRPIFKDSVSTLNRLANHYYAFEHSSESRHQDIATLLNENKRIKIVCTGGTINMPSFQKHLERLFGDRIIWDGMNEPELAVVSGASLADKEMLTVNLHHTAYDGYILFKDRRGQFMKKPRQFKVAYDPSSTWLSTINAGIPGGRWEQDCPSNASEIGIIFCPAHIPLPEKNCHFWEQRIPDNAKMWMKMPPPPVSYEVPKLTVRILLDGSWSMHYLNKNIDGYGPWILGSELEKRMSAEDKSRRKQAASQLDSLKAWSQDDNLVNS